LGGSGERGPGDAGFSVRIDHRALRTIAPDREPELCLPLLVCKIELCADQERIRQLSPAGQSAQRWVKWRQRNLDKVRAPTAAESVRNWLAYRGAQRLSEGRQVATREFSREDPDFERRCIERSKDYGLEL